MSEPAAKDSFDALLARFADELTDADPHLSGLEPAASEEALAAAEGSLEISFSPSYRRFLARWNGGSAYDVSLYGVGCEDGYNIVVLNQRGREEGLPEHLLGFASTLTGDVYCFDTSVPDDAGECPVSLIDLEQGHVIPACQSFMEWLERLPNLENELAEQRGPQPMTVEEWEGFLTRERAKLRRLSQTPARELTMPDPDAVRADLGGKIPVDPRHLKPRS